MPNAVLDQLIQAMRGSGLDFAAPPAEVRRKFDGLLATMPSPEGETFEATSLGGVPALECVTDAQGGTLLYFHGGGYIAGSAAGYRGLAADIGRAAGLHTISIDYRLAPEAPFPAALDDGVAAYRALLDRGVAPGSIAFAGDSAGGGLALSVLIRLRDGGLPLPAAALLLSPWLDLACAGGSMEGKAAADPSLSPEGLRACAAHYLGATAARDPLASPLYADLSGLPPLMVQVGSSEVLLDDATRLAAAAGAAGTSVRLEIWPEMIHVWQSFAFMLPEGREAVGNAAAFLSRQVGQNQD
ncbi:MAG: alpha/beta hydrolase [Sphingomonas bacterium]|nr:alpha/beta hydrolase [Sphingomonas bacterium]MDB5689840.1 alpha/beta hydrolase [Sphingomonas bacterium]